MAPASKRRWHPPRLYSLLGLNGYLLAAGGVVAAMALTIAVRAGLGQEAPYVLFLAAIIIVLAWAGTGPGLLATGLSVAAQLALDHFMGDHGAAAHVSFAVAVIGILSLSLVRDRLPAGSTLVRLDPEGGIFLNGRLADQLDLLLDREAGHAVFALDGRGAVRAWSKSAAQLTEWAETEILGRPFSVLFPPEAMAADRAGKMRAQVRADGRLEDEVWLVRKDGSEYLAHITLIAVLQEQGETGDGGFGVIVRDITDQRAAETVLKASANRLRSILATVPDAMVVIDEAGCILSFSAAAEQLFGYAEAEVLGDNVSRLMPSPHREQHDAYLERYLRTREKRIIDTGRIVLGARRDGSTFPMSLYIGEAVSSERRVFTGFIRDLTEHQATQERLEALQSDLIHVARVGAMGAMASALAHELNQPLTAIAHYVEGASTLLEDPAPEDLAEIREALDDAAQQALRAGRIVRKVREFVARGEVARSVEPLPALIASTADFSLVGAREKGVEVHFDLDPAASPVLIDRIQIEQVLNNLIRNAMEAMSTVAERRLAISTRSDGSGMARVIVADTGPGVDPSIASDLFGAFVSTKPEGMGLGLSICRTIVEANGGRIWAEPGPEGGSRFIFTLPIAELEERDDD